MNRTGAFCLGLVLGAIVILLFGLAMALHPAERAAYWCGYDDAKAGGAASTRTAWIACNAIRKTAGAY